MNADRIKSADVDVEHRRRLLLGQFVALDECGGIRR